MGGIGSFKLRSQFPDLFARAHPTVGFETNNDMLASRRNGPVLMWNALTDELVTRVTTGRRRTSSRALATATSSTCTNPARTRCAAVLPNHLMLAINDEFAPAASLGSAT